MVKIGDCTNITIVGDSSTLLRDFGTNSLDFLDGMIQQIANAGSSGDTPDEIGIKFMIAFVQEQKPRDTIEAMLCMQMSAIHVQAMHFVNRLANAETSSQREFAERTINKLMRTFVALAEALRRHRAKDQSRPVIQYVSVGAFVGMPHGVPASGTVLPPAAGNALPSSGPPPSSAALPPMDATSSTEPPSAPTGAGSSGNAALPPAHAAWSTDVPLSQASRQPRRARSGRRS